MCWLPDGRFIFALAELAPNDNDSNLWEIFADPITGKVHGKPERLTNWTGLSAGFISTTANGKRLVFIKTTQHEYLHRNTGHDRKIGFQKNRSFDYGRLGDAGG
jgi:hypothetical protein